MRLSWQESIGLSIVPEKAFCTQQSAVESGYGLDGLKPADLLPLDGSAEAEPFRNMVMCFSNQHQRAECWRL